MRDVDNERARDDGRALPTLRAVKLHRALGWGLTGTRVPWLDDFGLLHWATGACGLHAQPCAQRPRHHARQDGMVRRSWKVETRRERGQALGSQEHRQGACGRMLLACVGADEARWPCVIADFSLQLYKQIITLTCTGLVPVPVPVLYRYVRLPASRRGARLVLRL